MTSTSNNARAVAAHRTGAAATVARRRRPHRHRALSRRTAQPLHEALSSGLGCDAIDYRMSRRAEWR